MKITYLHQYFNTTSMSGGTRSFEMARRLVAMGHEVNMVTSWREVDTHKDWFSTIEEGIHVHWLPVPYANSMGFISRIWAFITFAIRSSQRAASLEADIVFASSTPLTISLPAIYTAYTRHVPMVFEVRDLWPQMPIAMGVLRSPLLIRAARELEKLVYRSAFAVVALSPGMKEGIISAGVPSSKIAVIPNSCDIAAFAYDLISVREFFSNRPWLNEKPLLIYAGTFGRVNNLSYAVSLAYELLKSGSNVQLLLVGDGAEFNLVKQRADEYGVLNVNLFIEPAIKKADVPALLHASSVASNLVIDLPEARVNSANKFFDTLAAGKPIFLNHGGWMHDLVSTHKCGIAAWGLPLSQVAQEIDSCLNDTTWLKAAGCASMSLAEKYFDRDILVCQLEQVLNAAVSESSLPVSSIAPGVYE
ncbi:glycosyltransferase family 4 protein [Desulfobacterales bacterium]|nr:glycosyltransferase family 4 protein [Desulfobacterales bacterium]